MRFILSLLALLLSTSAFAECINHVDGLVPQGTYEWQKDGNGNWAQTSTYKVANFQFQRVGELTLPDGTVLEAVMVWAPGYDPDCEADFFKKSDLFLKN